MVQIDIPVAFGTASLFAAAVEQGLRSERRRYFYQRALAASLIFQLLLVVWLPVYLLIAHFGFQTSHMWWTGDSITDYPWLLPAFLMAYFVACIAGFHVGSLLVTRAAPGPCGCCSSVGSRSSARGWRFSHIERSRSGHAAEWQAQTATVGLDRARFRRVADGRDGGVLRGAADRLQGAAARSREERRDAKAFRRSQKACEHGQSESSESRGEARIVAQAVEAVIDGHERHLIVVLRDGELEVLNATSFCPSSPQTIASQTGVHRPPVDELLAQRSASSRRPFRQYQRASSATKNGARRTSETPFSCTSIASSSLP